MATLTTSWQQIASTSKTITSNTTGYMHLYMKYARYSGYDRVYFEIRYSASNPYGAYDAWSQTGTMNWSFSYGGKTASGSFSSISITSNSGETTKVSSYVDVSHTTAYTGTASATAVIYQETKTISGSATLPTMAIWNDINAYQPDNTTQNGLKFDLTTSDGGSWTNLTNEPDSSVFTKAPGTTATITNIRPNVTGAHYTTNNVTNDGSTTFTWTFNTANYAVHLYSAWDTYPITYNANGGNQSSCPTGQNKVYNQTANITSQIPTHNDTFTETYLITFDPGEGTASYTELNPLDTWKYLFNGWNTNADGTGTSYASGASYSVNSSLTLYAQWTTSVVSGVVTFPSATRAGYDLVGWTRDPNNVVLVDAGYIPTQNETLYAVWSVIHGYINTRSNTGWKMPSIKAKDGSEWKTMLDGIWTQQTSLLPSTYTELSYITCTGTQYINPNFTPGASSDIEVTFLTTVDTNDISTAGGVCLIGNNVTNSDGGVRFFKAYDSTYIYSGFGTSRASDTLHTIQKNIKYTAKINNTKASLDGTTITTAFGSTFYAIRFFSDAVNTSLSFKGRIYGVKISNGNTLVRNLIPCIRNSDSVLGMYDIANNVFYTNAGTGTFGAGPKRTAWGNSGVNNTYSWFFVEGTEYPSKEDWTWRQWLDSIYNTDMWEPVEIDGVYYIGIEPDIGGYFCITNESGSSEANLLNKPIKNDFSYTIGRK